MMFPKTVCTLYIARKRPDDWNDATCHAQLVHQVFFNVLFIGIELDAEYFEIAKERINAVDKTNTLDEFFK